MRGPQVGQAPSMCCSACACRFLVHSDARCRIEIALPAQIEEILWDAAREAQSPKGGLIDRGCGGGEGKGRKDGIDVAQILGPFIRTEVHPIHRSDLQGPPVRTANCYEAHHLFCTANGTLHAHVREVCRNERQRCPEVAPRPLGAK